jgi:hypothetical protein
MAEPAPCCAKCGGYNLTCQRRVFVGIQGILVYCGDCGATISWVPTPQ